jgi:hypothetical protein
VIEPAATCAPPEPWLTLGYFEIIRPSIGSGAIISLRKRETSCYLLLRQPNDAKEHADAKS